VEQQTWLSRVLEGHYRYYTAALIGNGGFSHYDALDEGKSGMTSRLQLAWPSVALRASSRRRS
jgi:hypothetical protein